MNPNYNPQEIENRWQRKWEADRIYEISEESERPKFYALTMFPYTSGDLHIGHWYAMAPSDVYARFKRMQGYNVLHPMGFDAFGLPAENAAISHGTHPYKWTIENVNNMRRQLKSIGALYDWRREVITCLPEYYEWTQWFFLKLYHSGLAYRAKAPVNWCPNCQAVLANEQVVDEGSCWRCGTLVTKRDLEQWFFRITKYAEELLDFSNLDWPEHIKTIQKNWIGKSTGAEVSFGLEHANIAQKEIRVFTTRPDTIYGVTFFLLAPEHPLVTLLTTPEQKAEVDNYIALCKRITEYERTGTGREKTGVFLGSHVINRLNGEKVPIWITDYVLPSYGTGAVMGVPAHDERDFDFANTFNIPVRTVVAPPNYSADQLTEVNTGQGTMVNSNEFNGMPSEEAYTAICNLMESKGWGKRHTIYRLRDWLISRQRYWGAPIPMVYCDKCGLVPVSEKDLPVLLPPDAEFKPTGESPLKYSESFVNTPCPRCGEAAKRETDTMDTFMCSSWYFLRYTSPKSNNAAFDTKKLGYWMPVDLYTGGAEHAVLHLLYSRFFIKALRDMKLIDFDEPFTHLYNQGTIIYHGGKMSKSKGNVISPDKYVAKFGADAIRAYLMFIGPWELGGEWSDSGFVGISRWLNRIWKLIDKDYAAETIDVTSEKELTHFIHKTIKKTSTDIKYFRFNTMLSALMEFCNFLSKVQENKSVSVKLWEEAIKVLLLLLAPTAPHFTEELWAKTGHSYSIHNQTWPDWNEQLASEEEVTLAIQINGKLRDKIVVSASATEKEVKELILARERVKLYTDGKEISKTIYVPKRVLNIIVK